MDDDTNVVSFPGKKPKDDKNKNLIVTTPQVAHSKLLLGSWTFTCPHCSAKAEVTITHMIFRVMDVYCSCGTMHRITNPAFRQSPPKTK